jgi:hypothetical protein
MVFNVFLHAAASASREGEGVLKTEVKRHPPSTKLAMETVRHLTSSSTDQ